MSEGLHGAVAKQSTDPGPCSLALSPTHTQAHCVRSDYSERKHTYSARLETKTRLGKRGLNTAGQSLSVHRKRKPRLLASELLCALTHQAAELPVWEKCASMCLFPTINRGNGSAVVQVYFTSSNGSYCCSRPSDESQYLPLSL